MVTAPQPNEIEPELKKFFEDAQAFIATTKAATKVSPCLAIEPGTGEWDQWAAYLLRRCGRLPRVMQRCLTGQFQSFTVPARWPEWFDVKWVQPEWVPQSKKWRPYEPTEEERARNLAKLEALKRELAGAISMRKASERAKRQAPDQFAALRVERPPASLDVSPQLEQIVRAKTPPAEPEADRDVA